MYCRFENDNLHRVKRQRHTNDPFQGQFAGSTTQGITALKSTAYRTYLAWNLDFNFFDPASGRVVESGSPAADTEGGPSTNLRRLLGQIDVYVLHIVAVYNR